MRASNIHYRVSSIACLAEALAKAETLITIYKTITYVTLRFFTNVKNVRQIRLFMQNKPKVKMGKMNLSFFIASEYEKNEHLVK